MVKIQATLEMKLHLKRRFSHLTEKLNTFILKTGENKILKIKSLMVLMCVQKKWLYFVSLKWNLHPDIIMQIHKNFCFEELAGGKKQYEISI